MREGNYFLYQRSENSQDGKRMLQETSLIVFFLERSLLMLYGEVCAYKLDSYKSFEGVIFQ